MIDPRGQQAADDLAGRIDRRLLRVGERLPGSHRAAEQRDEVAPFQLIELHSVPRQPGPDYRISNRQGLVRG
jgi:hypothetical protein